MAPYDPLLTQTDPSYKNFLFSLFSSHFLFLEPKLSPFSLPSRQPTPKQDSPCRSLPTAGHYPTPDLPPPVESFLFLSLYPS
ncbi:Uncharacterized protein TCM_040154 [Theobroma cacao]|uniref:Uncharacterized protein n=1 Tax=Theobroma cacao TaxID=3641 RepID=A0A061GSF5_THECC|nr:Uncharacterized protein TCM_040154 [Theobroma cacao]